MKLTALGSLAAIGVGSAIVLNLPWLIAGSALTLAGTTARIVWVALGRTT